MVAGALLALIAAVGLLAASLGLLLAWLSVGADALAAVLLGGALRRRRPHRPPLT